MNESLFTFRVQLHVDDVSHHGRVVQRLHGPFGGLDALENNLGYPQVLFVLRVVQDLDLLDVSELFAHVREEPFPDVVVEPGKGHLLRGHGPHVALVDLGEGRQELVLSAAGLMMHRARLSSNSRDKNGGGEVAMFKQRIHKSGSADPPIPKMTGRGVCLQLLTASLSLVEKSHIYHSRYLKLGHRQVYLFVLGPQTTDPRISDDVHRWNPGVLRKQRDTVLLSIPSAKFTLNLLRSSPKRC